MVLSILLRIFAVLSKVSLDNRISILRQGEEANKRLMTSLSHDVRTPLTTLIGYLDAVHKLLFFHSFFQ